MPRLLPLLALLACKKGDDELNGPTCEDTPAVVAPDEVTPLGFAAADLLTLAVGAHAETLTWARGGDTALQLDLAHSTGEARYVDSEAVYPDTGEPSIAIGVECPDRVEVDVTVQLVTADGAFDEQWDLALRGEAADLASFHQPLDLDNLGGTYDMAADITEPDYDERSAWVGASFDASGTTGVIEGQVSGHEDCDPGDTCTAWAGQVAIGRWGEAEG